MTSAAPAAVDTIYTETAGTNCTIDGRRGVVTGFSYSPGLTRPTMRFAFARLETGEMLHLSLGQPTGDRGTWREVISSRVIERDEFDRINGIDDIRREMGWSDDR